MEISSTALVSIPVTGMVVRSFARPGGKNSVVNTTTSSRNGAMSVLAMQAKALWRSTTSVSKPPYSMRLVVPNRAGLPSVERIESEATNGRSATTCQSCKSRNASPSPLTDCPLRLI